MADLSKFSDADLERIANAQSLSHLSDAELEKLAAGKKSMGVGDTAIDMVRSLPGGLAKGITGLIGLPGTLFNPSETETVEGLGGEPITVNKGAHRGLPTGEGIDAVVSKPFGGYYEPKTGAGQFTERAAEFAPSVIGGPASLGTRIMGRVLAPAAGSVAAENLIHSDNAGVRSAAQIGGALLGAGAYGGSRALSAALKNAKLTPEEVANSHVANIAQAAGMQSGATNLPFAVSGRGQTAAEALGPSGVANLAALGRRGGETPATLATLLKERGAQAPDRILADFERASGIAPDEAAGNMRGIVERGQAAAKPLYEDAYAATPNTSPHLERLAQDQDVRKGMSLAIRNEQRRAVGKNEPFDPNAYGVTDFNEAGDPIIGAIPTWRSFDMGKRGIDEMLESYRDPITKRIQKTDTSDALDTLRRGLISATDEANPAMKTARGSAADYLSANEAFQQGQNHILSQSVPAATANRVFEGLNAANQEAYKAGIANKFFNQAQNGRLTPKQVLTPAVQDKLLATLGPEKGQQFIKELKDELAIRETGQRMMPGVGSITSDVLNATQEQDLADAMRGASHFARAAGDIASNRYGSAIANVLRGGYHFAPDMFRTGGMSEEARNAAGRLLMLSPEDFAQQLRSLPAPRPNAGAAALAPFLLRK